MKTEIQEKLQKLAFRKSSPFCYNCYRIAPTGRCLACLSDDLMRHVDGVGCEWSTDWVIKHLLEEKLIPIDMEDAFEESVRSYYPETVQVGWMNFDTVDLMKSQDPVSWHCALAEYESQEESEGNIMSFDGGSTYFWIHEIENMLLNED